MNAWELLGFYTVSMGIIIVSVYILYKITDWIQKVIR